MAGIESARQEAIAALRRFLDAVEQGDLDAESGHAKALLRRIEGAIAALEAEQKDAQMGEG